MEEYGKRKYEKKIERGVLGAGGKEKRKKQERTQTLWHNVDLKLRPIKNN